MAGKRKVFSPKADRQSAYYFDNKEKIRFYHIQLKYGLSKENYESILEDQHYSCAICSKHVSELSQPLYVDHCHETDEVRGLLCCGCNHGIGLLGDNEKGLKKALKYLKGNR